MTFEVARCPVGCALVSWYFDVQGREVQEVKDCLTLNM